MNVKKLIEDYQLEGYSFEEACKLARADVSKTKQQAEKKPAKVIDVSYLSEYADTSPDL